jgi:polynucleotide 5'-kinase involved in rRNA processing
MGSPGFDRLDIPPEWNRLAEDLVRRRAPATVYILGGTDTGKSTLAAYLCVRLAERSRPTVFIDLDPGQSSIGPPATVGSASVEPSGARHIEALRFVGSTSPPGSLLQHAAAAAALRRLHAGRQWSIIDACGFVQGAMAEEFQYTLLDLLRPELILRLGSAPGQQRSSKPFETASDMEIHDLPVSPRAVSVSARKRLENRLDGYTAYFRNAGQGEIGLAEAALRGKVPDLSPGSSAGGLLFAFCDAEQWVIALGIASSVTPDGTLRYVAPPFSRDELRVLQFGSLRLLPRDGELIEK